MDKKRVDISVTDPFFGSPNYYAVARDSSGRELAYAYGKDRHEAVAKVVQKIRSLYGSDVKILY